MYKTCWMNAGVISQKIGFTRASQHTHSSLLHLLRCVPDGTREAELVCSIDFMVIMRYHFGEEGSLLTSSLGGLSFWEGSVIEFKAAIN